MRLLSLNLLPTASGNLILPSRNYSFFQRSRSGTESLTYYS